MHALAMINKHFRKCPLGEHYSLVSVGVGNLSSHWREKRLRIYSHASSGGGEGVGPCLFSNGCPTFPSVLFPLSNPPSSHSLLPDTALLRSLARLALINVLGTRLAPCLSFPPPSSLLPLHSTFVPCHPRWRDTSRLQLQLVPVLSRVRTLHRCM